MCSRRERGEPCENTSRPAEKKTQSGRGASGFALLPIFWVLGFAQQASGSGVQQILFSLSFASHFSNLSSGVIDTQDLLFFLSLAALFLFLGIIALESRKWR